MSRAPVDGRRVTPVLVGFLLLCLSLPVRGVEGRVPSLLQEDFAGQTVVVPWIAQADPGKAVQQESDLYVHNPGPGSLVVDLTFRKQGLPEPDPPRATLALEELETVYLPNVLVDLFDRHNSAGFMIVEVTAGTARPLVLSFNRVFRETRVVGQTVPGVSPDKVGGVSGAGIFDLIGLQANEERIGYFGITNPDDLPLRYRLRAFDRCYRRSETAGEKVPGE